MNIANDSGANVRTDMNDHIAALVQTSSGATAPATTFAHQHWADTAPAGYSLVKIRDAADSAFNPLYSDLGHWRGTDGTAALPGWSFASGIEMGAYRIGANQLGFATAGTLAMAIDASQQVGIGIAAPDGMLHVHKETAGAVAAAAQANLGVFEDSGPNGISLLGPNSANLNIFFGSPLDSKAAAIVWNTDARVFQILAHAPNASLLLGSGTSGSIGLTLDGAQRVGIGVSPLTNMATGDMVLEGGSLALKEITTPTADTNYGKVYTKADDKLYFQDGAGAEHELAFV